MVKSASFTATFCYLTEVQLSLQVPAVDQPDQNSLCRLGAPPGNSRGDLETILEDMEDELYTEMVPISTPKPLNPGRPHFCYPMLTLA